VRGGKEMPWCASMVPTRAPFDGRAGAGRAAARAAAAAAANAGRDEL